MQPIARQAANAQGTTNQTILGRGARRQGVLNRFVQSEEFVAIDPTGGSIGGAA